MRKAIRWGLVGAFTVSIAAHAEPNWPLPDGLRTVEVNGYDMAYQEAGSGTPVVLVHGSLNDYRVWNSQVSEFAKKYRVIVMSLRHYYPEKWAGKGDDFSVEQHAMDVAAFIKKLNLGKVHLLGHSRGGAVVLGVAKQNPDVIKTLILEDASGLEELLPDTPDTQKMAAQGKELRETLARNIATGDLELAARVFVDSLSGSGAWSKRTAEQKQLIFDNMGTALKAEGRPKTSCEQIAKFDFPVLLLNGERSPKRYGEMFAAMRKCKDIPEPIVIQNSAHSMNRDNPHAFNSAVLEFVARHQ
jgi:pimeloyl-ACP methyl ester carboxylesterase